MNRLEKHLYQWLSSAISGVTPGLVLEVYFKGKKRASLEVGQTYRFYDWASLTKIVFTATQAMQLYDSSKIDLDDRVNKFLPAFPSARITLRHLLSHRANLRPSPPYFQSIPPQIPREKRWQALESLIVSEEQPKVARRAIYSCVDMLLMGRVFQEVTQSPLEKLWDSICQQLELSETHFHPNNDPVFSRSSYAPTSFCNWRKKQLQGEVDDPNAWSLGGVATNAGLFGPISDLSRWGLELRKGWICESKNQLAQPATLKLFCRRQLTRFQGDWGLGFMLPSPKGASCGPYFSKRSVGHTGFTGTSLWLDPKRDLLVTILSNRVYPDRTNLLFRSLRPQIHTQILGYLEKEPTRIT